MSSTLESWSRTLCLWQHTAYFSFVSQPYRKTADITYNFVPMSKLSNCSSISIWILFWLYNSVFLPRRIPIVEIFPFLVLSNNSRSSKILVDWKCIEEEANIFKSVNRLCYCFILWSIWTWWSVDIDNCQTSCLFIYQQHFMLMNCWRWHRYLLHTKWAGNCNCNKGRYETTTPPVKY